MGFFLVLMCHSWNTSFWRFLFNTNRKSASSDQGRSPNPEWSRQWVLWTKVQGHTLSCLCFHGSPWRSWWNPPVVSGQFVLQTLKDSAHGGSLERLADAGSTYAWLLPLLGPSERKGIYVSEALIPKTVMSVSLHLFQLWQSAGLDQMEQLVKERKEITGECEGQAKDLFPPLIHFPEALSSCWPTRFYSCLFLCISQFLVCLKVFSFFFKFECICHFPAVPAASPHLLTNPVLGWLPHWKQTALSLTLLCSAICLSPFLSDKRPRWIHWTDEARIKLHRWLQPGSCIPAWQHSAHRSGVCRCLSEGSSSSLRSKIIQAQDPLIGCQNCCFPWGDFLPQEFH